MTLLEACKVMLYWVEHPTSLPEHPATLPKDFVCSDFIQARCLDDCTAARKAIAEAEN